MDPSGAWDTSWSVLSGGTNKPVGLSAFNNRLFVFVKGATNNNIYYRSMDISGEWASWATLSGQTLEAPSAVALVMYFTLLSRGRRTTGFTPSRGMVQPGILLDIRFRGDR